MLAVRRVVMFQSCKLLMGTPSTCSACLLASACVKESSLHPATIVPIANRAIQLFKYFLIILRKIKLVYFEIVAKVVIKYEKFFGFTFFNVICERF